MDEADASLRAPVFSIRWSTTFGFGEAGGRPAPPSSLSRKKLTPRLLAPVRRAEGVDGMGLVRWLNWLSWFALVTLLDAYDDTVLPLFRLLAGERDDTLVARPEGVTCSWRSR